ncbi:MAG: alpha-ketoacid dehydrogenase subunit beta [Firmicutes bacterium]|nr:alpha-ketoacid dehydrogenase subunit beta [Bacillota bacterium]
MALQNTIETINSTLREIMEEDPRVFVLGEDVEMGGTFGATEGCLEAFGPGRVIDTPLAEASIVGIAIGAALGGLLPVAEIQFADFIHAAVDQIVNEAAKMRYRSNGAFSCPIVVRAPYGGGITGGLYHSQSVEALFFSTPGLKIVAPVMPYDVKGLLRAAVKDPDPVLFFEHKNALAYRGFRQEVPEEPYEIPIGKADVKREGKDVSVITYGLMVHYALAAAEELAREGIDVEVVDLRTLLPLDEETILSSVRKTGKVLIAHEDNLTGGIGGEIAARIAEKAFWHLDAPVNRLAAPDIPAMPYAKSLEDFAMPDQQKMAEALRNLATL